MSYLRLDPTIAALKAQVAALLAEAEATDAAEDAAYGSDKRGDEIPEELRRAETRIAKMRAVKEALEHEAQEKANAKAEERTTPKTKCTTTKKAEISTGIENDVESDADTKATLDDGSQRTDSAEGTTSTENSASSSVQPNPKAQRSFTDCDAPMMKTNDGFHYAYNAQAVVDEGSQVIVATTVTQSAGDVNELISMIERTQENLKTLQITRVPRVWLADAGYCSEKNLTYLAESHVNALIATGRMKHNEQVSDSPRGRIPKNATTKERMARSLRTKSGRLDYSRRKAIVEPVFGQMKVRQKAGHLRLRGLQGAQAEWMLHAICHNLRKLSNAQPTKGLALA